ncbi:hypothetical protein DV735_g2657, partial [Chaetothyriales sp. CBS 134920]
MARLSLDSERPMMAPSFISSKRTSMRYSTFSASPSFATVDLYDQFPQSAYRHPAGSLNITAASGMAEINQFTQGLDRLSNKKLEQQRFVPSEKKIDEISTLSIGAKVERALGRRMANQDATPSSKKRPLSILGHKKMEILSEKV